MATARMPDPRTLPDSTGDYREALAILKEQAKRGIPISSSIGWKSDPDAPGGNDLMEASIVGIGADPRTVTEGGTEALARAAVEAGADAEEFVERVKQAVRDPDTDRAEYEVGDDTVTIDPPEYMADAADLAMSKSEEGLGSDCGTGVGDSRADQIRADEVGPDVVDEVAAYLTSHEEDVTAEGSPSEWSDEEWDDCGNIQYAKWGGDGSGDALAWAQERANAVADARGEDIPYPNRAFRPAGTAGRNLDDPEFSEGDAVTWDWQGEPVHGRVADVGAEFTVSGNTITGDEGEAVYLIHDYDEDSETFDEEGTAKPQSSLSESQMDMPPANDDTLQSMTDDDAADSDPPDGGTTDDAQDADDSRALDDLTEDRLLTFTAVHFDGIDESDFAEAVDAQDAEFVGSANAEELFDLVSAVTGAEYGTVEDAMTALMEGGEQEGDKPDDYEDDEDDEERNLTDRLDALESELEAVRSGEVDIDTPGAPEDDSEERDADDEQDDADDPDATRDAEGEDTDDTADGPNWRA